MNYKLGIFLKGLLSEKVVLLNMQICAVTSLGHGGQTGGVMFISVLTSRLIGNSYSKKLSGVVKLLFFSLWEFKKKRT